MTLEPRPLDFSKLPLGSLYEERLVEDLLLLFEVVSACQGDDDTRLCELGVSNGRHYDRSAAAAG